MAIPRSAAARAPLLAGLRALKMARSAHAYVRGSTAQFYDWLASPSGARLLPGPSIWICGDCHVGNLGPIGRAEAAAVVEMRDLDQAVIGNPSYDLTRLALSLAMAARSSDLPGVTTARLVEELIAGYEAAFAGERPDEDPDALPHPLRLVMRRALKRTCRHLLAERLGERAGRFPLGRRFWPLEDEERDAVEALVRTDEVTRLVRALEWRDADDPVELVDAAYWVKGCSSLGLWRAAVLVRVGSRKRTRAVSLLDLKEAAAPVSPAADAAALPRAAAERVVTAARHLAPSLGERMLATTVLGRSVFVRELLPQDLKVELDHISEMDCRAVAQYLGLVVGRAHARQLDPAARATWMREIAAHRTKNIDAPTWLWTSVVGLVAAHERAYLEHCRRYALSQARAAERAAAVAR